MLRFCTHIIILLILPLDIQADIYFNLSPRVVNTYKAALDFNITFVDRLIREIKSEEPNNGFIQLLENYRETIILLSDENPKAYRVALASRKNRIEKLQLVSEDSPYKSWCLSEIYLQWSLIRIRYHDEVRAANDLRKANKYIKECKNDYPWFVIANKTYAVIEAMASAVPEQYKWLASIAGIEGEQGEALKTLNNLKRNISSNSNFKFLIQEINFYILFITQNLNPTELKERETLSSDAQKSGLTLFSEIWINSKNGNSLAVITKCEILRNQIQGIRFCYLDYLQGEAELNLLLNPETSLNRFLECTSGNAFVKSALRRIAWFHLISGNNNMYRKYMKEVSLKGSDYLDEDKQAQAEAKNLFVPNVHLLKSRLLFDGGRYSESLEILDDGLVHFLNSSTLTEYHYRKGRCYQKLNKSIEAYAELKKAINLGANLKLYFASSAALQLGIIKKNTGQVDSARYFLKLINTFPRSSYSASIEMKSAAILHSLN